MGRVCIAAVALILCPVAQAEDTCATFSCKPGFGMIDGTEATTSPSDAVCCAAVDAPSAKGTCADPDPTQGTTVNFQCPSGWTAKAGSDAASCIDLADCEASCCVAPPPETVTVTMSIATTITPYDVSSGSSSDSLASDSSANLFSETDSSGSGNSSGVFELASSGLSLPIWLWCLLAGLLCCCCAALAGLMKKKPAKKKTAPKPKPAPEPKVEEEELLLPALVPVQPSFAPVTTSAPFTTAFTAAPQMYQQPAMSYAPQMYQQPMVSAGYPAQVGAYGYGLPGGYPGTVV